MRLWQHSSTDLLRRGGLPLVIAGVALGIAAEWASLQRGVLARATAGEQALAAGDFVVGFGLIVCGFAAERRRPESGIGALISAAGFLWFFGSFSGSSLGFAASFGALFVTLHRGPLVHAIVSYPSGRVGGRLQATAAASGYALALLSVLTDSPIPTCALAGVIIVTTLIRQRDASGPERRARLVALAGGVAFAAILLLGAAVDIAGAGEAADRAVVWAYQTVVLAIAIGFVVALIRSRWTDATVTGLVVELGGIPSERVLRERLANALGDPSLTVGYWMRDIGGYVDEDGRPLPPVASGRETTFVDAENGEPLALLVHHAGVPDDAELLSAVSAAARLAVSNVKLQREIRSQVEEVEASRRRIVESAEVQRRRLEVELRGGAEHRLEEVEAVLAGVTADGPARTMLDEALAELGRARVELRELGRGILPELLTRGGLRDAVDDLGLRAAVPVTVTVAPGRFAPAIEAAAYFVCSEALVNIGKHARATLASIEIAIADDRIAVTVADDGAGGAALERGTGLRGLADRVEALGGTLRLESQRERGTCLRVELPLS